jgi:putative DNA methylase
MMPPMNFKHYPDILMAKTKGKSKKELLTEQIAAAVGAGREVAVETVDFSDPNRPKTCLEVDFPIIPINQIAGPEMCSGAAKKPIYAWQKWWARRSSAVFRGMLLASVMRAPDDQSKAAKAVWDVYYANHQKRGTLRHLKVAEPFMGGGTTIVEGSRLGMQMFGCDLNPVAWFVVKNEMAQVDIAEVERLLAEIETKVKPLIMPYYACDGPDGEQGKWFLRKGRKERQRNLVQTDFVQSAKPETPATEEDWEELPASFDILSVPWQERINYRYEGPEIIYTFWAKHGPCQREGCGHRTPIKFTPVVAIKTLSVDTWQDVECRGCRRKFDIERHAARMAPGVPLFVVPDEKPFAVMDSEGRFTCPQCGKTRQDAKAFAENNSPELGKARNKKIELTLLIHPQWMDGCPKYDEQGREYGGSATDSVEATIRWNNARASKLRFIEVRGKLPEQITCPETGVTFTTTESGGTVTKPGNFECQASTCGTEQPNSESFAKSGKTAPVSALIIQGYSSKRSASGLPYNGRFFASSQDTRAHNAALAEWNSRKDADLRNFWPRSEIPFGHMTHQRQPLPDHGYTHWWKMFNPVQLLLHSILCKTLVASRSSYSSAAVDAVLGIWHRYLQHENMLCFWVHPVTVYLTR